MVGRLASSIAHEINNPLDAVTNLLYLARRAETLKEAQSYVDLAEVELRRVSAITTNTLRFHKQFSRPQEVDLNSLVDGGRLQLRSRESTQQATGKSGITITIADSGAGMSQHTLNKLFTAFFTTKGLTGTGLGLWSAKTSWSAIMARSAYTPASAVTTTVLPSHSFCPLTPSLSLAAMRRLSWEVTNRYFFRAIVPDVETDIRREIGRPFSGCAPSLQKVWS